MADWATISSMATAGGTMVLALATFVSTRSANQAARAAERAVQARLRPLLLTTRFQDDGEKIMWQDEHFAKVPGGQALIEQAGDVIYMAVSLRNAGNGLAVIHGWALHFGFDPEMPETPLDDFRRQGRDLYISAGDNGFWQAAVRDADDPLRLPLTTAAVDHGRLSVDLLYGDFDGGQRTITRIGLTWRNDMWVTSTSRHWNLDRANPR